jgi:hypothetical protein
MQENAQLDPVEVPVVDEVVVAAHVKQLLAPPLSYEQPHVHLDGQDV